MIEVILGGGQIFFRRFGMKAVARHALARWQMVCEEISYSGQGFVAGNELDFARLYLRYMSPYFRKLRARDLR